MISTATLKNVAAALERILCCDEAPRAVQEHLSFALAHINEAGKEAEDGTGRSPVRLQDDLWEERRRAAARGLERAWAAAGWPGEASNAGRPAR